MKNRFPIFAVSLCVALGAFIAPNLATPSYATDSGTLGIKGVYLLADYPAITVQPGTSSTVNLQLRNYDLPPERLALSVSGVPKGWKATLLGGGQPIAAAMPAADDSVSLSLRLDVPKDAGVGSHTLTVSADGGASHITLPVQVTLAKELPAKLTLSSKLPELRGSTKSDFSYTFTIKNDSGKKLLVSLAAEAPRNFDTSFTEAYGSQQLTAIPVEAGKTKDIKLKVTPPDNVDAGHYPVAVKIAAGDAKASAQVALDVSGQPKLSLAGRDGLLSARATAGKELDRAGNDHQHRHRAGRERQAVGQCAERLEGDVPAQGGRAHRAQPARRRAGDDLAAVEGDCRRLRDDADRLDPWRKRHRQFPRLGHDLDDVGHCRGRPDRRGAVDHGRRRCSLRSPLMSNTIDAATSANGATPLANVIEVKGLTKRYGEAIAVNDISFNVGAGEIFGLLGPNGAGKTTTILMLLGLSEISAGEARVFGHDPARDPLAVKRRVGYLPDTVGFYDNLTAADNLHYTARLMGMSQAERFKRIAAALDRVGLSEVANKKVGTFSRGMRQRLGLAEIVMKDARIAILDEPTNGLDPQASLELLDLIRSFKADGISVVISSHLLDRVQSICDRVALFNAGRIALIGTVGELGRQVLGRRLCRRGRSRWRHQSRQAAFRFAGRTQRRRARARTLPHGLRQRPARRGGGRSGRRWRPAQAIVARPAEPGDHLHPLLPVDTREHGGAPCSVVCGEKARPCRASVS